jgi:branched-subunit amino acid aminotransferase/4-amino-4-deoxychorismate lyase
MISLWKLAGQGREPLVLPDMSSMDSITRQLPGGFYTTFRTYHGRTHVLGLGAHLDRLYHPLPGLGISPSVDRLELRRRLSALLETFPAAEARLRLVLAAEDGSGMVFVAIEPFQPLAEGVYLEGVKVVTTHTHREHPELKATTFISESQSERRRLLEQSVFEGLLVRNGRILEGLTSNFFYMTGGKLGTAAQGVLNGVTRRQVIKLAREARMRVLYRALPLADISAIDEAFLTSSSRSLVPIITIDDEKIGSGRVGEGAQRLMHLYEIELEKGLDRIW